VNPQDLAFLRAGVVAALSSIQGRVAVVVCLFVCLFCLFVCLFVCLSVCWLVGWLVGVFIYLFIYFFIYLSIYSFICFFLCLFVCLSVCPFVRLSACLPISQSVCLFACLLVGFFFHCYTWLLVSTQLKNILQIGSFPPCRDENKTYLKPPARYIQFQQNPNLNSFRVIPFQAPKLVEWLLDWLVASSKTCNRKKWQSDR